jgi:tetratricopeptide (TPR) repeat protein
MGGGTYILFGDLLVDESKASSLKPLVYEIVLYNVGGTPAGRQFVSAGGRYQFMSLANGQYELVVLLDHEEIARMRVEILPGPAQERVRQDLTLAWKPKASTKPGSVSAADFYKRTPDNEKLFVKAEESTDQKRYDDAIVSFEELVAADPHDFQAWTELGTVYLFKRNYEESEKAYVKSVTERPGFFLGQLNLGRLRALRKNFEGSIEPLTAAVTIQATSADANYYLGESYLQIKKGSKAVIYLNQALKLDPIGKAEAHLRLATLYNAVGMKDKAAIEYQEFLKKKPDFPESKKLKEYIEANKPKT